MLSDGKVSIAICDRCCFKVPYQCLKSDPNYKGLKVCPDCIDKKNGWLLPPIRPDAFALKKPRPDTFIGLNSPPPFFHWDTPGLKWDSGLKWDELND